MTAAASNLLLFGGILLTFLTALTGFLANGRRIKETKRGVADVEDKVQEVHVLVNSQLQAVAARVTQLISVLEHAGVPVPPNRNGEGS